MQPLSSFPSQQTWLITRKDKMKKNQKVASGGCNAGGRREKVCENHPTGGSQTS